MGVSSRSVRPIDNIKIYPMSVIEGLKTGCGLLAVMVGFSDHPTREVERTSGGCAEQACHARLYLEMRSRDCINTSGHSVGELLGSWTYDGQTGRKRMCDSYRFSSIQLVRLPMQKKLLHKATTVART